jgi:hypothetical protein
VEGLFRNSRRAGDDAPAAVHPPPSVAIDGGDQHLPLSTPEAQRIMAAGTCPSLTRTRATNEAPKKAASKGKVKAPLPEPKAITALPMGVTVCFS